MDTKTPLDFPNRPHDAYPVPGYYEPYSERVRVCQHKKCRQLKKLANGSANASDAEKEVQSDDSHGKTPSELAEASSGFAEESSDGTDEMNDLVLLDSDATLQQAYTRAQVRASYSPAL